VVEIQNTSPGDIETIFKLFDLSADYQEQRGYPSWRNYDRSAIIRDIETKQQYKVSIDTEIAIVFSVAYSDPIIWRELDDGKSVYLHRIVVNPVFKGQRLFQSILDWAKSHCKKHGLHRVRMDTWAANPKIIEYYKSFGFTDVENFTTPDTEELPQHNRQLALRLLEFKV
jgi:GNAT superfamily N-acetyltransferase